MVIELEIEGQVCVLSGRIGREHGSAGSRTKGEKNESRREEPIVHRYAARQANCDNVAKVRVAQQKSWLHPPQFAIAFRLPTILLYI